MVKIAAIVLAAAFALTACTRVQTGARAGNPWTIHGTVRVGAGQEPDMLNPAIGSMAFASDVYQLVFDGLIRYDDKGEPIPDLALEVPSQANGGISKDGTIITYHLVRNATWHDGAPFTAADVIFTYRALMNPANNNTTRVGYDRIAAIEAPDPYTVVVKFKEPYAPGIYLFRDLNQGAILPEHLLGKLANINQVPFNQRPVGTGPFVLREWHHGGELLLEANPKYFKGKPKIDHVIWKFIPDQNTLLQQFKTHEIDVGVLLPPYEYDQLKAIPGITVKTVSTLHWEHLVFNTRKPPLDDRRVRVALCYAMDEDVIFKNVYHSLGTKGPTDQNPDYRWYDKRIAYYPHDLKKAGDLLAAAGWLPGPDGYRYRNGRRLTFGISTVAGNKTREALEVVLQSQFKEAGVELVVKNYPAATLFAPMQAGGVLYGGKYDTAIFQWVNNTPDPDDSTYIGPEWIPPQGQNMMFYQNPVIGKAQHEAVRTFDFAKRKALYDIIQQAIITDVPEYNFVWQAEIAAANSDLAGLRPTPVGSDFWNVADWTI